MTLAQYLNGQFSLTQNLEFVIRIVVAGICGAAIGFERSRRFKEAGIRTHVIVCCAAALMMIVSKYSFADLTDSTGAFYNGTRGADPARIAAQVISGISFLGAGVIFKNGSTVKGLTTAAGIWATAGIGLAIGAGMYFLGLIGALLVALFQIIMHIFTVGADSFTTNHLQFTVHDSREFREDLYDQLKKWNAQVTESRLIRGADGCVTYDLTVKMPKGINLTELCDFMDSHEEVTSSAGIPLG